MTEKRTVINEDGFITRLTDDSDSDGEIQYRFVVLYRKRKKLGKVVLKVKNKT